MVLCVYITFPDRDTAHELSRQVLEKRYVACANILNGHQALYRWDGAVQSEEEVAVIFKTTREQYPSLETFVTQNHPYDVPCIVAWPIEKGYGAYLDWVKEETETGGSASSSG